MSAPFLFDEYMSRIAMIIGGPAAQAVIDAMFAIWPDQTDYVAIPGDSGLMVFSTYRFLPLQQGAPNDATAMRASRTTLTTAARLRKSRRRASAHRLRPLIASSGAGFRESGRSGIVALVIA